MSKCDLVVDARGLSCPMPLVKASQSIKQVPIGGVIEVLATDPASKEDIPRWARRMGHEVIEVREESGVFHVFIKRMK